MKFIIENTINNIKCPKIFINNDIMYIFGLKSLTTNKKTIFNICLKTYDIYFNFIDYKDFVLDNLNSPMMRYIEKNTNGDILLSIEDKYTHTFFKVHTYIYIYDINNNTINLIRKTDSKENEIIHKCSDTHIFASHIEIDEDRPDYYWGKYLFNFKHIHNTLYRPIFDTIVNYEKDKGHVMHFIDKCNNNNNEYIMIFSIRHKDEANIDMFLYKIYCSKSTDLLYFYDTYEILIENNLTSSKWYCYPEIFKHNNIYYVMLNQDDFGKTSNTLIGKIIF